MSWLSRLFSTGGAVTAPAPAEPPTQEELDARYAAEIAREAELAEFRQNEGVPDYVDPDDKDAHAALVLWVNATAEERTKRLLEWERSVRLTRPHALREWRGFGAGYGSAIQAPGLFVWRSYEATQWLLDHSYKTTRDYLAPLHAMPLSVWRWCERALQDPTL